MKDEKMILPTKIMLSLYYLPPLTTQNYEPIGPVLLVVRAQDMHQLVDDGPVSAAARVQVNAAPGLPSDVPQGGEAPELLSRQVSIYKRVSAHCGTSPE